MSWNPTPTIGGASWSGNAQLITKNQLLSTSSGFYEDLKDFNFSTISVSTLNVPQWISTPVLYVSDIQGASIDISGIIFDASGLLYAPLVSSQTGVFQNITNVSTYQMTFKPTFTGNIQVTFDLGLGEAIGGLLAGLGAAVGGALIGVGTGVGLAIQGAETGIATLIAGRPQNFITNNTYETVNFTSQLQISTLGDAYPLYSTIFRTVSSVSANSVPGPEIFTSSFFYPGQICIRSVSDPFNLITGDSNLNTSTIQSFGQWVPLEGLEPENIVATSISTINLSTQNLYADFSEFFNTTTYSGLFSNVGIEQSLSLNYQAPAVFQTGSVNQGAIIGNLNNLYLQTTTGFIFTDVGSTTENASLYLGPNANESLLNVSSIFSRGNIQANSGYFSTLQVEQLIVISSLSTIFTQSNVNVLSTAIVQANIVTADFGAFSSISTGSIDPFSIQGVLGNPNGPFDITRTDSIVSTSYFQISSLQQNILNYTLIAQCQDQSVFSAWSPAQPTYTVSPTNVEQWASTMLYCNPGADIGGALYMTFSTSWQQANMTGQFDLTVDMTQQAYSMSAIQFAGSSPGGGYLQTFFYQPPTPAFFKTWRFTVDTTGVWSAITPAPPPPQTINCNVFSIYQDINDTYIKTTDRLHLVGGDILFDGVVGYSNLQVQTLNAQTSYLSNVSANIINASNIIVNPNTGGFDAYYLKQGISWSTGIATTNPLTLSFINNSPDLIPTYNILAPFIGNNYFTSYNVSSWNNSLWNNNVAFSLGVPRIFVGDLQQPLGVYSGFFYINNGVPTVSPQYALPIYRITSAGSNLLGTIAAGDYARIATLDGINWTFTSPISNPQGTGGTFSNILSVQQGYTQTNVTNTQTLVVQAPNTFLQTGTAFLYADQVRVNSHAYGTTAAGPLPSYPIGIENNVYIDPNISWTQNPPASGIWQSDAANVLSNITGSIYYDFNSWIIQIIPSRFRTNTYPIYSWDVQPAIFPVGGTGGYAWGFNRYIQIASSPSGPGVNTTDNWNWYIAIPKNYCTY